MTRAGQRVRRGRHREDGAAEERRGDGGRNAREEESVVVEPVVLEAPERLLVGADASSRTFVAHCVASTARTATRRGSARPRASPGTARRRSSAAQRAAGFFAFHAGASGAPPRRTNDLPLHVEAAPVVARGRRLADALPGEDDAGREGPGRDLRDQGVDARDERRRSTSPRARRSRSSSVARPARDLAERDGLEVRPFPRAAGRPRARAERRRTRPPRRGRESRGPRPASAGEARNATCASERRRLQRVHGRVHGRRQVLDDRDADEVGGGRRTGRGRRREQRKTKRKRKNS